MARVEFGVADGKKGEQALSVRLLDPLPSVAKANRRPAEDMAVIVEDLIKVLDNVGNALRRGRYPGGHRQGVQDAARRRRPDRGLTGVTVTDEGQAAVEEVSDAQVSRPPGLGPTPRARPRSTWPGPRWSSWSVRTWWVTISASRPRRSGSSPTPSRASSPVTAGGDGP